MHHATGTFEVAMKPEPATANGFSHMTFTKTFHGGLEGTSALDMLSSGNPSSGSAGYVALEKVTGTLDGAQGTFVLQHSATMDHGTPSMIITVVPASGTEALKGLSGKFDIQIASGKHSYTFAYTLNP